MKWLLRINFNAVIIAILSGLNADAVTLSATVDGGVAATVSNGATIDNGVLTGVSEVDSTITILYTVSNVDLSSVEAGANAASFQFDVALSGFTISDPSMPVAAPVGITAGGNIGVGMSVMPDTLQITFNELLSVSIGTVSNIMGFNGLINFDGISGIQFGNFQNSGETALLSFPGSTFADLSLSDTMIAAPSAVNTSTNPNRMFALSEFGVTEPVSEFELTRPGSASNSQSNSSVASFTNQFSATAVPEPSSVVLFALGGLLFSSRRRR